MKGVWKRWVADVHLWLSLLVGLQMLAWVVSGLFMVSQPIERVRSEHRMVHAAPMEISFPAPLASLDQVAAAFGAPVHRVSLEHVGGRLVYLVEGGGEEKAKAIFDAQSAARISPVDEAFARQIAEDAIAGDGAAARLTLIEQDAPIEYRGALPAWRADFADADNLAVYIDASTGRVTARRSDLWRAYDFLWSLHIMDYGARENFNHPLLIVATAIALVMTVAGFVLLALRLPQRLRRNGGEP